MFGVWTITAACLNSIHQMKLGTCFIDVDEQKNIFFLVQGCTLHRKNYTFYHKSTPIVTVAYSAGGSVTLDTIKEARDLGLELAGWPLITEKHPKILKLAADKDLKSFWNAMDLIFGKTNSEIFALPNAQDVLTTLTNELFFNKASGFIIVVLAVLSNIDINSIKDIWSSADSLINSLRLFNGKPNIIRVYDMGLFCRFQRESLSSQQQILFESLQADPHKTKIEASGWS